MPHRSPKLLLLPVAAMITVLGTHTIIQRYAANAFAPTIAQVQQAVSPITPAIADADDDSLQAQTAPIAVDEEAVASDQVQSRQASSLNETALFAALHLGRLLEARPTDEFSDLPDELDSSDDSFDLSEAVAAKEVYVPEWQTYAIQSGDTFAVMAEHSLGLGYSEVMGLLKKVPDKKVLTNLRVGHSIDYKLDEQGQLLALKVMKNSKEGYLLERNNAKSEFAFSGIKRATQATQRLFAGTVEGSFVVSAQSTGLSSKEVAELTRVLSKKINFRRDARQGDQFQVLIESDMVDGKPLESRLLAARYEGARADLTVLHHGDHFYTPDGRGLDLAFERYPFRGHYRISSPFNLQRHHPVTGRISPHRGTDFAMPAGTPVYAAADGRVIKVANHPIAGRYIVIAHDNGYKTRYLHLSKPLVKKGERVKMDERIALSGNTGRTTGAHLHYEVIVNNHQVNAMRVRLPDGKQLAGKALAVFKKESKPLMARLDDAESTRAVARN